MKKIIGIVCLFILLLGIVYAAQKPTVGGDTNTWGDKLNEYLGVSLNDSGNIKDGVISKSMLNFEVNTPSDIISSTSTALYLQPGTDSSGRVRLFQNTTGSPLISMYGHNPVTNVNPWMYMGMFDYTGVDGYMRAVIGASGDYGDYKARMEIQSPYQVRITGVDNNVPTANVRVAASSDIQFHSRTVAETDSASFIKFDTRGQVQNAPPTIETNNVDGQLLIQPNVNSNGRIRLFRDTTGNPMLNVWGYDRTDNVQKYLTLFVADEPAFTEAGATSRAIITSGGTEVGERNALELQSPSQVRITAVDTTYDMGTVRIAADQYIQIHPRTEPEADALKFLTIDTVDGVDGADITLKTNNGNLVLNPAGDVVIKNGFTGTCASTTTLTVVNGIITACS